MLRASLQSLTPCKVITINKTAQIFSFSHKEQSAAIERERSTRGPRDAAERAARVHRKTIAIFHRQKVFPGCQRDREFSHIYLARKFPDTAALSHSAHTAITATIKGSTTAQFLFFCRKDTQKAHSAK